MFETRPRAEPHFMARGPVNIIRARLAFLFARSTIARLLPGHPGLVPSLAFSPMPAPVGMAPRDPSARLQPANPRTATLVLTPEFAGRSTSVPGRRKRVSAAVGVAA